LPRLHRHGRIADTPIDDGVFAEASSDVAFDEAFCLVVTDLSNGLDAKITRQDEIAEILASGFANDLNPVSPLTVDQVAVIEALLQSPH
jgi:hypothetical protein